MDKNRYRKSIDIIDIDRFNPSINIDCYRKSIEIKVTEKIIYRLLPINKIDNNRWGSIVIDNNQQKIIIDFYRKFIDINQSHKFFFLYGFVSIDIENEYSSMIDIDYYRWSVYRLNTSGVHKTSFCNMQEWKQLCIIELSSNWSSLNVSV